MADDPKPAAKKLVKAPRVQFHVNFYQRGVVKFAKDSHYPRTPETESQVKAGNAKNVEVEMAEDDHLAEHKAAEAAYAKANAATLAAEGDARARGQLK